MSYITIIVLIFSFLAVIDRILGNKFGLGAEFDRAFMLLGTMALSMIGMIVLAPAIAEAIKPVSEFVSYILRIDPSIIPASLFANDMGGAPLAVEMAQSKDVGLYNALVVSSMMGVTVSFTIPFALGIVDKSCHSELLLGLLCGIVTVPVGCFVSGLMCKLPVIELIKTIIPLVIFSLVIGVCMFIFPDGCVKVFKFLGGFITVLITIGLYVGIYEFLTGKALIESAASIEDGASICLNAAVVLAGAFPFIYVVSRFLSKPLKALGSKVGINAESTLGLISTLVTSATAFASMYKMDKKGAVMNAAFSVSAAFSLGSHLAFTMAFDKTYIPAVITGKLVAGVLSLVVAAVIYERTKTK